MRKYIFLGVLSLFLGAHAQKLEVYKLLKQESFRGLSVVNDSLLWISGTNGTIGRSQDGGKSFYWIKIIGFDETDFRDIEAFNAYTALIMGIGEPAYILKTEDGGDGWRIVYENLEKGMFLDAMDFWDNAHGVVVGDAIGGTIFLAKTDNGGESWKRIDTKAYPKLAEGEACFASSGSNIKMLALDKYTYITGGVKSRFFINDKEFSIPINQGKETTGANAFDLKKNKKLVVVGGDFLQKDETTGNAAFSKNTGKKFELPEANPNGYRSGVVYVKDKIWISCGLNGIDISKDDGETWQWLSTEGFHACKKAKDGNVVYLVGNGKIGKITF